MARRGLMAAGLLTRRAGACRCPFHMLDRLAKSSTPHQHGWSVLVVGGCRHTAGRKWRALPVFADM